MNTDLFYASIAISIPIWIIAIKFIIYVDDIKQYKKQELRDIRKQK